MAKKPCALYQNQSNGGILNDGSACRECGAPASEHEGYQGQPDAGNCGPFIRQANDRQVGGSHYKTGGEEHWDRQWRLYGRGYFVGCITKYVERYPKKKGIEDLEKAQHFLQKLIELETEYGAGGIPPGNG